jgi:tRNA A22 N-methylase
MLQQKGVVHNIIIKEDLIQGTEETLAEVEVEEILVEEEEDRLYVIIVINQDTWPVTCLNPCTTCTYCRALDHVTEYCPQLVVKWQARGNQNQNPNQNVQKISAEKCNEGPRITVVVWRS